MSITRRQYGIRPRHVRAAMAVFAVVLYLVSGALHAACHLDVTTPAGDRIATLAADHAAGHSDMAGIADHHCHGCFSVSIPAPVPASALVEPLSTILPPLQATASDLVPGLDPPPPKALT
jgi:hypothetical protein